MADNPELSNEDYQALLSVGKSGMSLRTPMDRVMQQVNQANAVNQGVMANLSQGTEGHAATDAMRNRGLNVGFGKDFQPQSQALEKVRNGVAKEAGRKKTDIFGGK